MLVDCAGSKMTNTYSIEVQNLVKVFQRRGEETRAVDGISFSVKRGEIFGLLGPNGAGKSTTLKVLTTLIAPTSGKASVLGHDVVVDPLQVRRNICVVIQENALELYLSVRNNFRTFGRFHGLGAKEIAHRSDNVSEQFGLRDHMDHKGIDLSGGLKRRVQVAKMFMVNKPIVFLDEATTGMDTFNKRTTIEAIKAESRKGRTIVLTTHMLDEAEILCDSLAIMNHGKLIVQGSTETVKSMGLRLLSVNIQFEKMTRRILQSIYKTKPVKVDVNKTDIEVTVRDEKQALQILASAKRNGSVKHFEVSSATLEDVFVELVDKKASGS